MLCIQKLLNDEIDCNNITFGENLTCQIKLEGEKWDGKLDASISKIIISIQNLIYESYSAIMDISLSETKKLYGNQLRVTAEIQPGCSNFKVNITELLKEALKKMSSTQACILILILAGMLTGYESFANYNERLSKNIDTQAIMQANDHLYEISKQLATNKAVETKLFNFIK